MNTDSRIKNSLKNVKFALAFYLINLILQFFFRKIFLDHLGPEVLGLNTTAMNLLQFLNLAELGVGAAVSYSLYKPLATQNHQQVNEVVSIQGYLYSRIGIVVIFAAVVLMFFFPFFFSNIKVPLWYAYTTFFVLLVSALAGYFFNYQQIILVSDQKEYKLNYALQGIKILKVILQILSIFLLTHGYLWWLFWEVVAIFATIFGVKYVLRMEYPWLKTTISSGKQLMSKHPEITLKTKQLFAHKIAGFALNESSPLIIFAFTSLSFIANYGNYLLVIAGITALLGAIFNSTNAGVGNLVSEADKDKIFKIFDELFTLRFLLACIACYAVYKFTPIFISFWIGKSYLLKNSTLLLLVFMMFINISRLTVDSFLNAYGLFKDIWAPIVETAGNITLSILLGYLYGINGVLVGALLSLLVVVLFWKPLFLFKNGIAISVLNYAKIYLKLLTITVIAIFLTEYFISLFYINPYLSISNFLIYSVIVLIIFSSFLLSGFLLFSSGMRSFVNRLKLFSNR